jgi:hypothetical protein
VTIKFNEGANLNIFGTIIAAGTASEKIIFTSNKEFPAEGDWGGIDFHPGSIGTLEDANGDYAGGTIFSYCEFYYATNSIINRWTETSPGYANNLHIMNCVFKGSGISSSSTGRCENNSATDASIGMGAQYNSTGSTVKIKNNNVINGDLGGAGDEYAQLIIQDNKIVNGVLRIGSCWDVGIPHKVNGNTIKYGYIRTVGSYLKIYNNTITCGLHGYTRDGIEMGGSYVSIYNNTIANHKDSGIKFTGKSINITNNIISGNGKHGIENLSYENVNISITDNEIIDNSGHGILTPYIETFTGNDIYGNTLYDFYYTSVLYDQIATNNYWGTTNSSEISNNIYDFEDDITLGKVSFGPFAAQPFFHHSDPIPDIEANGSDCPLSDPYMKTLSIAVALDAGDYAGTPADWWVLATAPTGEWYYYDYPFLQWRYAGSLDNVSTSYQGALNDIAPLEILTMDPDDLPEGKYVFYFGVDTIMNGSIDYDEVYYDSVEVADGHDKVSQ